MCDEILLSASLPSYQRLIVRKDPTESLGELLGECSSVLLADIENAA